MSYVEFANSNNGIVVRGRRIPYRELLVVLISIVFVVAAGACCIALILRHSQTIVINVTETCTSSNCLYASAKLAAFRDTSLEPCTDFYQYACGSWKKMSFTQTNPNELDRTMFHIMREDNEDKLMKVLKSEIKSSSSYEKKVKSFYKSCMAEYNRTTIGGKPFIEQILKKAYGWNVIPDQTNWNNNSYNLNEALKKVHIDFWSPGFFSVHIQPDWLDYSRNTIEIGLGGLTLSWWDYTYDTASHLKLFNDTKKFMKTVAALVIRDSGIEMRPDQIDAEAQDFANDVFDLEFKIANMTWYTLPSENPHEHQNRVSVKDLNSISPMFNWVDIITTMFSGAGVNANTKVVLLEAEFLGKLNSLLTGLPNMTRTINNYLTWRLMLGYVTDLGWEYIHANREFYVARTGLTEFLGVPLYCFNKIKYHFTDALGALYIRDHLLENDKATIDEVVAYLKMGLQDRLRAVSWMEDASKRVAIEKVKLIVDKVGYPQWMTNNDEIDKIYAVMDINEADYLANLIQIAKLDLSKMNNDLKAGEDRTKWRLEVYDTWGLYDLWWNELLISAGLLQWPIYFKSAPKYYNFGSLGVTLAHELIHSVDEIGGYYLPNGTFFDWWTNKTTQDYNQKRACLENLEINVGPYYPAPGVAPVNIKIPGTFAVRQLSSDMAAIRIAYNAYKDWIARNQAEKVAPGLSLTNEQTFFLAYAQTQCFVRRDTYSITRAERMIIPEDVRLNLALKHSPDFAEAFKCPQSSNMRAENVCEIF